MADPTPPVPVTALLHGWRRGDPGAQDALFAAVYQELHRIAQRRMAGERAGHTLQPAALVHEAWLKLAGAPDAPWEDRAHFYGVAARLMRQVLIDHARARGAARRAGGVRVDLTHEVAADGAPGPEEGVQLLELHEALERLAALDARRAQVVELRYFGGLERQEIAEVLGVTERMVKRDLTIAQAWLQRELTGGDHGRDEP